MKTLEKDIFMYRSYIASHRYRVVLDEISNNETSDLLACRMLADYFQDRSKFDYLITVIEKKLSLVEDSDEEVHEIWTIVASTMYINEGLYEAALKILKDVKTLECLALQIVIFIKINRLDLAKKVFVSMQEKDDDATVTQLAQAWINMELGGEKLQDAFYCFDDFNEKFTASVLLLNNMAVCDMGQQKLDENVSNYLRDGLDREPNNENLLINLMFYAQQTDKTAETVVNRYVSLLKDTCKKNELVLDLAKKEAEFDRLCLNYEYRQVEA